MYAALTADYPVVDPGIRLRLLEAKAERQFRAMLRELDAHNESYHFGVFAAARQSFEAYVATLDRLRRRNDFQQQIFPIYSYGIYHHGHLVGEVRLRKKLPPEIQDIGGHITMYVRPGLRRKGIAQRALALALQEAQRVQIYTMLLATLAPNPAAVRLMTNAGGIPIRDIESPVGIFHRFRFFVDHPA